MELKILDKTENEMHIEIKGESHTLLNMLKSVLLEDERVHTASYDMKHVSISDPVLFIKTEDADPVGVLKDAVSKLIEQCDDFISVFSEAANA